MCEQVREQVRVGFSSFTAWRLLLVFVSCVGVGAWLRQLWVCCWCIEWCFGVLAAHLCLALAFGVVAMTGVLPVPVAPAMAMLYCQSLM